MEAIIARALRELELEEKEAELGAPAPQSPSHNGSSAAKEGLSVADAELPWCVICNADAALRCQGCDDDLYCRRCYKESHDRAYLVDHPTVPYNPPPAPR